MNSSGGLKSVRCVSFDAGGTLLHPYPSVGEVYEEIAQAHGCDCSAAALDRGFQSAFISVRKDRAITNPEERERDFWRRVVRRTLELATVSVLNFEPLFADIWEAFAHANRWRIKADAISTLRILRRRGYQLAIISNWDRRLHTVLEETGLRGFFDVVVISSEAGYEKPEAEIFRLAEDAFDADPSECLHVGDSRSNDVEAATAASWGALLVRHDDGEPTDREIGRLAQLTALLPAKATTPRRRRNL